MAHLPPPERGTGQAEGLQGSLPPRSACAADRTSLVLPIGIPAAGLRTAGQLGPSFIFLPLRHAVVRRPDRLAARAVDQARMASGLCRYGPGASAEVPLGGSLCQMHSSLPVAGCTLHRHASTGRSVRCEPFASRWSNRLSLAGGGTAGVGVACRRRSCQSFRDRVNIAHLQSAGAAWR